jgi:hypothetical protein
MSEARYVGKSILFPSKLRWIEWARYTILDATLIALVQLAILSLANYNKVWLGIFYCSTKSEYLGSTMSVIFTNASWWTEKAGKKPGAYKSTIPQNRHTCMPLVDTGLF